MTRSEEAKGVVEREEKNPEQEIEGKKAQTQRDCRDELGSEENCGCDHHGRGNQLDPGVELESGQRLDSQKKKLGDSQDDQSGRWRKDPLAKGSVGDEFEEEEDRWEDEQKRELERDGSKHKQEAVACEASLNARYPMLSGRIEAVSRSSPGSRAVRWAWFYRPSR